MRRAAKRQQLAQTIADYRGGWLAYDAAEVGILVEEIERLRKVILLARDDLTLIVAKTAIGKDRTVGRMSRYLNAEVKGSS